MPTEIHAECLQTFLFLTDAALVPVSVACVAHVSSWTVAVVHASDRVGITLRALSTGITDAGVISMAEQS